MAANQPPWPREWLMTDERIGDRLWDAVGALPEGAGVVFRHYATPEPERIALGRRLARACRERRLALAVAGNVELAALLGAELVHNPAGNPRTLPVSRSAHSADEADRACRSGACLIFLSPMHATRSHPERDPLPRESARQIVARCDVPVIALGGMNRARFEWLRIDGFYGWAGIDAWLGEIRT
jgi:thiamine-phosphate pyrophosphorylase